MSAYFGIGLCLALAILALATMIILFRSFPTNRHESIKFGVAMLAIISMIAIAGHYVGTMPYPILITVEELAKFAPIALSRNKAAGLLVSMLFPIFEVLITKSLLIYSNNIYSDFIVDNPLPVVSITAIPILMHWITSAIYFSVFVKLPVIQLASAITFHWAVNDVSYLYLRVENGTIVVSYAAVITSLAFMGFLFAIVWIGKVYPLMITLSRLKNQDSSGDTCGEFR